MGKVITPLNDDIFTTHAAKPLSVTRLPTEDDANQRSNMWKQLRSPKGRFTVTTASGRGRGGFHRQNNKSTNGGDAEQ